MYEKVRKLTIQSGDVPANAFYGKNISELQLVAVNAIGTAAFLHCGLTGTLTIPNTVTSIGKSAFGSSIDIPSDMVENKIDSIYIDMTESEFAKVTLSGKWYGSFNYGDPTINYKEG